MERVSIDVPGRRLVDQLSLRVPAGACVALVAPSGAGKTTVLQCIAGLDRPPTDGTIEVDGEPVWRGSAGRRADRRLRRVGIVFQFGELLPELSIEENVALPLRLQGATRREASRRAARQLDAVGLGGHADQRPDEVSGGELQRAAVARATVHEPAVVLADEPTGALDASNSALIARLLVDQARRFGAAIVVATHDPIVADAVDTVVDLRRFAPAVATAVA